MIRPAIDRLLEQAGVLAKRALIVLNVGARRNTSNPEGLLVESHARPLPEGLLVESHARPLRYTGDLGARVIDDILE